MLLLYAVAGIGWRVLWAQFRPLAWVLAVLFAVQALFGDAGQGVAMVLRCAALVSLAALVTLTTRTSEMVAALERALRPLARFGIDPDQISLVISLALRFIPVLGERVTQIREAQRARGLDRNILALAVPLLVHCLAMADAVADAIEARCAMRDDSRDAPLGNAPLENAPSMNAPSTNAPPTDPPSANPPSANPSPTSAMEDAWPPAT